ncbi:hypothetical protein L873DRAFT_1821958 [Choiromyces venosus 120613-1]|uniref:Uncharacterized protein n=1 Tax=Choiromyces venosus 120613-1 TaxID=1336337 RepID=A0A3N4IVT5_9PEZI|nr:hypothetical protein L873DRAFT_1821958 [Choiromyces venosus 120613-1]
MILQLPPPLSSAAANTKSPSYYLHLNLQSFFYHFLHTYLCIAGGILFHVYRYRIAFMVEIGLSDSPGRVEMKVKLIWV